MATVGTHLSPAAKKRGFFGTFARQPQKTFLRKALFQVHLWTGLLLALYVIVIGITGSITVFRLDIAENVPRQLQQQPLDPARYMSLEDIRRTVQTANPGAKILSFLAPDEDKHAFASLTRGPSGSHLTVIHPYTAELIRNVDTEKNWAFWVGELHENLFLGRTGELISGWASILLLLTLLTGLVLWWPGVARWVRALGVNFRAGWKRINFDLHSAIGLWTLLLTSMWCVTTVLMVWPQLSAHTVNAISPLTSATKEPKFVLSKTPGCRPVPLQSIVDAATASQPQTRFAAISPAAPGQPVRIFMARGMILNRGEWDEQAFDPCTGKQLFVWKRWVWKSVGDAIIGGARPLHVGFVWGRWAQWVWFLFGLSFPVLTVTGLLMYWNRYLGRRWKTIRASTPATSPGSRS